MADHLVATFWRTERRAGRPPDVETALAELYRETGQRAYLDLARQFVEQRGHGLAGDSGRGHRYLQDHLPIRDTVTLEGHAVRALYLEAGVTDVASGDRRRRPAGRLGPRWEDMVATKTYLTGGNGSRHSGRGFGDRFELPPDRAYNETCAAIASFHWSWRLLLATGDARYADLHGTLLYNAFGASISTDGQRFFYVNPLQRRARPFRGGRPGPPAGVVLLRLLPAEHHAAAASLQHYLATMSVGHPVRAPVHRARNGAGGGLGVQVDTGYPWSGEVRCGSRAAPPGPCGLALRVPAWTRTRSLLVNGEPVQATAGAGYLLCTRTWRPGDVLAASST